MDWKYRVPASLMVLIGISLFATAQETTSAAFLFSPSTPMVGTPVIFDGAGSLCAAAPCTYGWMDDADGSLLGEGATMSFTFRKAGIKYVRLTITDALSQIVSIEHDVFVMERPPVAVFTYAPVSPIEGSAVSFDGTSSSCFAAPCSYRWADDADGSFLGTGPGMSFTFRQAGMKYVRLTISDALSQTVSIERNVLVSPRPPAPIPAFTYAPTSPVDGSAVLFDGSSSSCFAAPCSYSWTNAADGSVLGSAAIVSLTFRSGGTKAIQLTVTDALSQSAGVQQDVVVSWRPPTAVFTFSPAAPIEGTAVLFDASSASCPAGPCSYRWTSDIDGSLLGVGPSLSSTFAGAGTRPVRLTLTDAMLQTNSVVRDVVVVARAPMPVAAFTYAPTSPVDGSAVLFDGSSSSCFAAPCSYSWTNAADGSVLGSAAIVSLTFRSGGTKAIRLTVTDALSQSAGVQQDVVVSWRPPTAVFTFSPAAPIEGTAVLFDASSASCPAGPCSYRWTSDIDGSLLGVGPSLSSTFAGAGTRPVRLTLTDAMLQTNSVAHDVVIVARAPMPVAAFTYAPAAPMAGSAVSFDASRSSCFALPCTYRWSDDADPSRVATGLTASFTFSAAGTYRIRLTVTDTQSQTANLPQDVVVVTQQPSSQPGFYYVSTTGDDAAAGTISSPWKTIQKAASVVNPGETVVVNAGTYNERVQITRSGAAGLPLTFRTNGTVVMQGFNVQANYVKVVGFEITNTPGGSSTDRANGSGFYIRGSGNEIAGNNVHHSVAAGIYLAAAASNTAVSGNRIAYAVECGIYINGSGNWIDYNDISHTRSVGGSDADGIRFFGSRNTVRKNSIHDIFLIDSPGASPHIDAFQTWGPATDYVFEQNWIDKQPDQSQGFTIEGITQPVGNIIIRNNVFITRGGGYQPDVSSGDGGLVTNLTVANNTMVSVNGTAEYAIWLFPATTGALVKNNAIHNHGNYGTPYIRVEAGASGLDIGFNAISNSLGSQPIGIPYAGDLWLLPPLFVNLAGGDFHLQALSPLVERGVPLPAVADDYDGAPRPSGLFPDIGAFEFRP